MPKQKAQINKRLLINLAIVIACVLSVTPAEQLMIPVMLGLWLAYTLRPLTEVPNVPLNLPLSLPLEQVEALKIHPNHESSLPQYAGSLFEFIDMPSRSFFQLIRREKGKEAPLMLNGSLVTLNSPSGLKTAHAREGYKVRSFCLSLLAALSAVPKQTLEVMELKRIIHAFLKLGATNKNAGFEDFQRLMEYLAKASSPQFESILKRHVDLNHIALENATRPPQNPVPLSRGRLWWHKLKVATHTMTRAGLLTPALAEHAEYARKIGLSAIPTLPPKSRPLVQTYPMLDAIHALQQEYRAAGEWLMHHLRIVSFRELCQSIQASCKKLESTIRTWDSYVILSVSDGSRRKSQAWLADIAYRYLPHDKLPSAVLEIGYHDFDDLYRPLTTAKTDHFLFFDDGAYSCAQFDEYLDCLLQEVLRTDTHFETPKHLYFVFGYFPKAKYQTLSLHKNIRALEDYNISIHVQSAILTDTWETMLDKEEQEKKEKNGHDLREKINAIVAPQKPLIMTEWKRPDPWSLPAFISEGAIQRQLGKPSFEHGVKYAADLKTNELDDAQDPIVRIQMLY